jgi:hypothetical protein
MSVKTYFQKVLQNRPSTTNLIPWAPAVTFASNLLQGLPYNQQIKKYGMATTKPAFASEPTPTFSISEPNIAPNSQNDLLGLNSYTGTPTGGGTTGGTGTYDLSSLLGGNQDLGLTGAAYDQSRQDIEAQNPLLDQSYNLAKGDIENSIAQTESGALKQKETNKFDYGNILKSIAQTYGELGRKATGTFAGLNTLDSSSYGENMLRLAQGQGEQTATTQRDEQNAGNTIDENVQAFKSKATSELSQLGIQYQQGKNAISSALANNDIQGAAAIKSTIDQIRTRAMSLASLLQGEGSNVSSLISATNGNLFGQNMGKNLSNLTAQGAQTYTVPTSDNSGSGFIAPDGKKYKNYLEYLASMGQA